MKTPKDKNPISNDRVLPAKFVKRAKMWCVTKFKDGKQIIEWYPTNPQHLT